MKRILTAILALLLAVSLAGCGTDSLEDYKRAVEKTEQIKKGQTAGEFSIEMDFNTEGMTAEQIKMLNYFKTIKGSFNIVSDDEAEKAIFRNYLNMGGLGFDFDLFVNGEEVYMKLPVIGKYMRIDQAQASEFKHQVDEEARLISEESQEAINEKWLGLLTKEDVFKGRNMVLTTPDGEVKTTEYTIKLTDDQIKTLAADSMDILYGDAKLKENYEEYFRKNVKGMKDVSFEEILANIKENMKDYEVESFSYTAYVDIDGYIVNELIEFSMKVDNAGPASLARVSFRLDIKNWGINKEQKFDFPELTEANTIDIKDMDENMPFVVDGLFENKD